MKYDGLFDSVTPNEKKNAYKSSPFAELEMVRMNKKSTLEASARKQKQRQTVDWLPFKKLVKCTLFHFTLSLSLSFSLPFFYWLPLWLFFTMPLKLGELNFEMLSWWQLSSSLHRAIVYLPSEMHSKCFCIQEVARQRLFSQWHFHQHCFNIHASIITNYKMHGNRNNINLHWMYFMAILTISWDRFAFRIKCHLCCCANANHWKFIKMNVITHEMYWGHSSFRNANFFKLTHACFALKAAQGINEQIAIEKLVLKMLHSQNYLCNCH